MAKTLSELFDRCKSETYQDCMDGEVRSLAVSHDHQQMICHVAYQKPISLEHLDGLGKEIAQAYGLTRFSIAPRYQMDALTPEYIDLLRQDLCHRMPSATGLLAASRWDFADGHLRISMGDTARGYFSVALRQMQERIETETGQRVVVEAVPFAEEQVEKIIESQYAARNAALKAAMDAMPVAEPMPEKPRKNLKVRPAGENGGYQRPKVEKVADENLILGKLYTEEPIPIRDALGEFDRVTIKGDVFFVDHREITSKKTGKEWVKIAFDITDNTNSIRVSKFTEHNQCITPIHDL